MIDTATERQECPDPLPADRRGLCPMLLRG